MAGILVFGSINIDLVVRVPRFPIPGETLAGRDFRTVPGGKGANQAVAAARQGASVAMSGRVGRDAFGDRLLEALRAEGIDTTGVSVEPDVSTGLAIIPVDDAGQNHIILVAGANSRVSPADADRAAQAIAEADLLLLQLEVPLPAVMRAAAIARDHGVRVILNAAPACPLPAELTSMVHCLVVNELEAARLTGLHPSRPAEAAAALRRAGPPAVIVTLGRQGALLVEDVRPLSVPGFDVPVADTTAAGDAFVGAFAAALAQGKPAAEAARWANAAGALAVTRPGAQPSLPTRAEVQAFLVRPAPTEPG